MVISNAKKYLNQGLSFQDLVQEGLIGLNKGIEKFDLDKRFKGRPLALSTYVSWWIRQGITRAIDNTSRGIRIPIHRLNECRTIKKKFRQFREKHGCDPTSEELEIIIRQAAEEDPRIRIMDAKEIKLLGIMLYPMVYLDQANSEDENLTLLDYMCSDSEQQPECKAEVNANQELVMSLLAQLEDDEKVFIMLMFGLIDGKERSKKDMVASIRKMGEAEVKEKTEAILAKLRKMGNKDMVSLDFWD